MSGLILVAALAAQPAPPEVAPPPRAITMDDSAILPQRWVIQFKTDGGKDYVEHLKVLNAKLLIPIPGGGEKVVMIPDLTKPKDRREATADDLNPRIRVQQRSDTFPQQQLVIHHGDTNGSTKRGQYHPLIAFRHVCAVHTLPLSR